MGGLWERLTSLINTFGKETSPSTAGGYSVHAVGVLDLQLPSWSREGNHPKENALRVTEGEDAGALALGILFDACLGFPVARTNTFPESLTCLELDFLLSAARKHPT